MEKLVLDLLDTVPYETWLALNVVVALVCVLVAVRIDAKTKREAHAPQERRVMARPVRARRDPGPVVPDDFKTFP